MWYLPYMLVWIRNRSSGYRRWLLRSGSMRDAGVKSPGKALP